MESRLSGHFRWRIRFFCLAGECMNASVNLTVKSYSGFLCCFSHGRLFFLLCSLALGRTSKLSFCTLESMTILRRICLEWGKSSMGSWVISWLLSWNDCTRVILSCCEKKNHKNKSFPKEMHTDCMWDSVFPKLRVILKFLFEGRSCLSRTYHLKFKFFICLC